jgi:hypothetical protein
MQHSSMISHPESASRNAPWKRAQSLPDLRIPLGHVKWIPHLTRKAFQLTCTEEIVHTPPGYSLFCSFWFSPIKGSSYGSNCILNGTACSVLLSLTWIPRVPLEQHYSCPVPEYQKKYSSSRFAVFPGEYNRVLWKASTILGHDEHQMKRKSAQERPIGIWYRAPVWDDMEERLSHAAPIFSEMCPSGRWPSSWSWIASDKR